MKFIDKQYISAEHGPEGIQYYFKPPDEDVKTIRLQPCFKTAGINRTNVSLLAHVMQLQAEKEGDTLFSFAEAVERMVYQKCTETASFFLRYLKTLDKKEGTLDYVVTTEGGGELVDDQVYSFIHCPPLPNQPVHDFMLRGVIYLCLTPISHPLVIEQDLLPEDEDEQEKSIIKVSQHMFEQYQTHGTIDELVDGIKDPRDFFPPPIPQIITLN